jgi:hypothetical protein
VRTRLSDRFPDTQEKYRELACNRAARQVLIFCSAQSLGAIRPISLNSETGKFPLPSSLQIEKPESKGARPEPDEFHTIGQFYAAVEDAIDSLCDELGEAKVFCGNAERQIQPEEYYGSGEIVVVTDRDGDAQILGRGNGKSLAHFYRFNSILKRRHYTTGDKSRSHPQGTTFEVDCSKVDPLPAHWASRRKLTHHPLSDAAPKTQPVFPMPFCVYASSTRVRQKGAPKQPSTAHPSGASATSTSGNLTT